MKANTSHGRVEMGDCPQSAATTCGRGPAPRLLAPPQRLIAASFAVDFTVAMAGLAVQNLGIHILHAPNLVLGLLATFSSLAYTIGCLVSGSISDRYGRRRCAAVGCAGAALAWLLLPHLGSWRAVLCVVPLVGGSLSLFWPSVQAWLAELTTGGRDELSRNLGLFNIMWATGLMLGPVATGYLWGVNYAATLWVPALAMLALIPLLLSTPRGHAHTMDTGADECADHEDTDLYLKLAWIGNFASWFAGGVVGAMFPKLGHELGFSIPAVGWLLFFFRSEQIVVFVYTRYEHRWQYKLWPMLVGQVVAALGMLLAAITSTKALFALGFALAGSCAGMTYVSSLFYALHGREHGRGKTSGFHEAVLGGGIFLGPLVGGLTAQYLSLRVPFAVACGLFVGACAWQALLGRMRFPPRGQVTR